nr:HD domain-containing protein [Prevotella sp.]
MLKQHAQLIAAMVAYDKGDPMRIQHFMKVHDFAASIASLENIDAETVFILETAAIVHDIGIHVSERKYGSSNGKYQEKEGPAEARKLLLQVGGYTEAQINRVEYLVGHHHTYKNITGMDYQILVEADFLVNIYEDNVSIQGIEAAKRNIFKTETGIQLLNDMFGEKE